MADPDSLAAQFEAHRFEEHRAHLRDVAYRILGSASDAEDAVQEAWLRLSRTDTSDVENFGAQTGGMSGGYGYCMGPAIAGDYVVAGALVQGGNGGVLNIYALSS